MVALSEAKDKIFCAFDMILYMDDYCIASLPVETFSEMKFVLKVTYSEIQNDRPVAQPDVRLTSLRLGVHSYCK
jgi:hypothetical protein